MNLPMNRCRRTLSALWFGASAFLFLLVFFQTHLSNSDKYLKAAFSWLLPSLMPTLSLMVGVMATEAIGNRSGDQPEGGADPSFFKLTFAISLLYLLTLLLVLLLQPFSSSSRPEALADSNIYLGPFQGLVAASIGAFFVKRASKSDAAK